MIDHDCICSTNGDLIKGGRRIWNWLNLMELARSTLEHDRALSAIGTRRLALMQKTFQNKET